MNKLLLLVTGILLSLSLLLYFYDTSATECLEYKPHERAIEISCGSADVTDLYNMFGDLVIKKESQKVWVLDANVIVKEGAVFHINSTDTLWLKVNSTAWDAYSIVSEGNLRINSIKLTGWDTLTNNYPTISADGTKPRSYIRSEKGDGTLDIFNSELGYLGYNGSKSSGLSFYSGSGSTISNNRIHDLWNGFYSSSVENITVENNQFYNNIIYGIDPHSGTHDSLIRKNAVYDNGWHGIICSKSCYNITIDSNRVFGNGQTGIIMHANTTNSTVANNTVYDNRQDQVSLQDSSDNNSIYNNKLTGGISGIEVAESSNNKFYDNTINNAYYGILMHNGSSGNLFESNDIMDAYNYTVYIRDKITSENVFVNNKIAASPITRIVLINNTSMFINNSIGNMDSKYELNLLDDSTSVFQNNTMFSTKEVIKSDSGYEPLPLSARTQSKESALDIYLTNQKNFSAN